MDHKGKGSAAPTQQRTYAGMCVHSGYDYQWPLSPRCQGYGRNDRDGYRDQEHCL